MWRQRLRSAAPLSAMNGGIQALADHNASFIGRKRGAGCHAIRIWLYPSGEQCQPIGHRLEAWVDASRTSLPPVGALEECLHTPKGS